MTKILIARIFLVLFVLSTTSCASKLHVRLFTANLSPEDATKIEDKLKSSKFKYSLTNIPFPRSIKVNSIIYNPSIDDNKKVYDIIDALKSEDFRVAWTSLLSVENHSFTSNNIGVYLFSEGYAPPISNNSPTEINEYGSYECGSNLTLRDDSTFEVLFEIWDYELGDYREVTVTGLWEEQGLNNMILSSEEWFSELSFERKINIEPDVDKTLTTVSLIPALANEKDGSYLKMGNKQPNVNCTYRTHIIN